MLNAYHCYWLQGNTLNLYMYNMNIHLPLYAVYKYMNKKILSTTVKKIQSNLD